MPPIAGRKYTNREDIGLINAANNPIAGWYLNLLKDEFQA